MPPRSFANPPPKTESARQARASFFCELCQKGYSRMNEFEAHESSYDHQHKKRLKEMKQMQKDPNAVSKAKREGRREDERAGLISIKVGGGAAAAGKVDSAPVGGFKKGGFRSAFGGGEEREKGKEEGAAGRGFRKAFGGEEVDVKTNVKVDAVDNGEDSEDCGYEYYDPRKPTGCDDGCALGALS